MNTEAERFQAAMEQFHHLYAFMIAASLAASIVYCFAGWVGAAAVGCFLLQSPVLIVLSQKPRHMQAAIDTIIEERVQLIREIVNGIRFIKYIFMAANMDKVPADRTLDTSPGNTIYLLD